MPNKICTKCKEEKPLPDFHKSKNSGDGYRWACKSCVRIYAPIPTLAFLEYKRECAQLYREKHPEKVKERQRRYQSKRQKDPAYKLRRSISERVRTSLKQFGGSKTNSTFATLAYSSAELKKHLEDQFEDWMTWENYGWGDECWNLGHRIPQAALRYEDQEDPYYRICWDLRNLFPQPQIENMKMGSLFEGVVYHWDGPNLPLSECYGYLDCVKKNNKLLEGKSQCRIKS
jgi:hypothetical protein